ncbi:MAG TPA: MarR family transcriptional regulator [Clostridiaceae bacterium]|nr:MarR family transcriptional regulator [Clostridiaceae bacterium]
MKKAGLRDIKKRNSQIILGLILESGPLSRIEIAKYTKLSPSTVTVLVNEMIEKGLLKESGVSSSTGGRKRIELSINSAFGDICIIDIKRKGAVLNFYDMNLNELETVPVTNHFITGNDLLLSISSSMYSYYKENESRKSRVIGIGLLFHEDVQPSDCNVIYSTSLSSANISLREALLTQFRIPVIEEYMSELSIWKLLNEGENKSLNNAHISIGNSILVSITLEGKPLKLNGGRFSDITPLIFNNDDDIRQLNMLEELYSKGIQSEEKEEEKEKEQRHSQTNIQTSGQNNIIAFLSKQITNAIVSLCTLFSLDTVYLSGSITRSKKFMRAIREMTRVKLASALAPDIVVLNTVQQPIADLLAKKVRCSFFDTISI